jgi:hypothetical protein
MSMYMNLDIATDLGNQSQTRQGGDCHHCHTPSHYDSVLLPLYSTLKAELRPLLGGRHESKFCFYIPSITTLFVCLPYCFISVVGWLAPYDRALFNEVFKTISFSLYKLHLFLADFDTESGRQQTAHRDAH